MPLITTHKLSIGYKKGTKTTLVQSGIDLSLHKGEIVCLLGSNGCGKSTLLKTLAGLQPALYGEASVEGHPIDTLTQQEKAQIIALVLTDKPQIEYAKVIDIVRLGQIPYTKWFQKMTKKQEEIVQKALMTVGIESKSHRYLHTLSDGERQRVFIAKALAQETPIILLDEPTAHLDLPSRIATMQLLKKLAREQEKTILLSTHEIELALRIADKICLMQREKPIIVGTPKEIVKNQQINQAFESDVFHIRHIQHEYSITYQTGDHTVK